MESLRPFYNGDDCVEDIAKASPEFTTFGVYKQKETEIGNISMVDKYKPNTTEEIFRNVENIACIKNWLREKTAKNKYGKCVDMAPFILLVGDSGVGKSELLRLCFIEEGYSVIHYDEEIRKNTYECLKESIILSSIEKLLYGGNNKLGIIIDNFQTNLSTTYRQELIKLLRGDGITSPVIFVSYINSNLTDLIRGKGLVLYFENPEMDNFIKLGTRVCKGEKIKISKSALQNIVYESKYDIRSFINTVCIIGKNITNKKITDVEISKLTKIFKKDLHFEIRDTIKMFIKRKDLAFKDKTRFTSLYTSTVVQENYINMGIQENLSMVELSSMADSCCDCDIIKKHLFNNQDWNGLELGNIIGTMKPLSILSKVGNYNIILPNRKNITKLNRNLYYFYNVQDVLYIFTNIIGRVEDMNYPQIRENSKKVYEIIKSIYLGIDDCIKMFNIGHSIKGTQKKDIKRICTNLRKFLIEFDLE